MALERLYSVTQLQAEVFSCRSKAWLKRELNRGAFPQAYRDRGGWMVPASSVQAYLDRRRVTSLLPPQPTT